LFIPSLLWRVIDGKQGDGSPSKRPTVTETNGYVAPSWSWASVGGKITHNSRLMFVYARCNNHSSLIDILETHVLPTNQDKPYGQIQEANIRLRGTLISSRGFYWTRYGISEPQSERAYNVVFAFAGIFSGIFSNLVPCITDDMKDCKPQATFLPHLPGRFTLPRFAFCLSYRAWIMKTGPAWLISRVFSLSELAILMSIGELDISITGTVRETYPLFSVVILQRSS
jgi:hypothetical protein